MASNLLKIVRICNSQFKCNYLKNEKYFHTFFFHFQNLHQILDILKKRMIVIGNVFPKLETVKILLRPLSKKRRLRTSIWKHPKYLPNLHENAFIFFSSFSGKFIPKVSSPILGEILLVFVNTFGADCKYPVQDCENLQVQFKCNYLKNEIYFLDFYFHFWNLHQILNILKKRMIVIANVFPKLRTVKILLRQLSKKRRFRTCFQSQHVKESKMLVKSKWEHFCHVFSSFSLNLI